MFYLSVPASYVLIKKRMSEMNPKDSVYQDGIKHLEFWKEKTWREQSW